MLCPSGGGGVILELTGLLLGGVIDGVVVAPVGGKFDVALCGDSSGAIRGVDLAAEVEALEGEGFGGGPGEVRREHGGAHQGGITGFAEGIAGENVSLVSLDKRICHGTDRVPE